MARSEGGGGQFEPRWRVRLGRSAGPAAAAAHGERFGLMPRKCRHSASGSPAARRTERLGRTLRVRAVPRSPTSPGRRFAALVASTILPRRTSGFLPLTLHQSRRLAGAARNAPPRPHAHEHQLQHETCADASATPLHRCRAVCYMCISRWGVHIQLLYSACVATHGSRSTERSAVEDVHRRDRALVRCWGSVVLRSVGARPRPQPPPRPSRTRSLPGPCACPHRD